MGGSNDDNDVNTVNTVDDASDDNNVRKSLSVEMMTLSSVWLKISSDLA